MSKGSILVYVTGLAGSGKSTLVWALNQYLETIDVATSIVNLDPGVKSLTYEECDLDIRDMFTLEDIMAEYNLGPNGAQIAASDLISVYSATIKDNLKHLNTPYVLIDTPGQIELFAYREATRNLVTMLDERMERSCLLFVVDPLLCRTARDFVSQIMLAATVHLRFPMPMLNVLSKTDLLIEEDLNRIMKWSTDTDTLYMDLEDMETTMDQQLSMELFRALEALGVYRALTPVSSMEFEGLEHIYFHIQSVFFGGEDIVT